MKENEKEWDGIWSEGRCHQPQSLLTKGQDRPERSQKRRHHARDCDDTAMRSAYNKQGQGVTYSHVLEGFMFRGRYRPLAHYYV